MTVSKFEVVENESFKIRCIKTVSDPIFTFFVKDSIYEVKDSNGQEWTVVDETGQNHIVLDSEEDEDEEGKWFDNHFVTID